MEISQEIDFIEMLLPLAAIIFIIALGVVFLNQQFRKNLYKQQLEQEALKNNYQQKLLQVSMQVQEDERKRIAQDLHDELGAILSIGRMQLVQLEQESTTDSSKIKEVRQLIENTLVTTRRISHELMPLQLSVLGLEKTIKSLVDKVKKIEGTVHISKDCKQLPQLLELGLYRIFSELINNTIKHSEANQFSILIDKNGDQLNCQYKDNGKGIKDSDQSGLGLRSIENRVNTLGGNIQYGTPDQEGFLAHIELPFPNTKTLDYEN